MIQRTRIGLITSGSLLDGLTGRLDNGYDIERLRVGQFVVVQGQRYRFFSMLTDVLLATTTPTILADPPGDDEDLLAAIIAGRATYGTFKLSPQLMPVRTSQTPRRWNQSTAVARVASSWKWNHWQMPKSGSKSRTASLGVPSCRSRPKWKWRK